ncbi:MAG TPA: hypothetical protein DD415_00680 [Clostridiales bacterium]|nr:hypothetical protein [Clostridiales bacterium]
MYIGVLYLLLTFVVCFILVHVIKLAYIGLLSIKKKPEPPKEKEKEKEKPAPKPQPVYYIVEKKRTKKTAYSDPKEIEFKK